MSARLGILIAILVLLIGGGLYYYLPKINQANYINAFETRQKIGGALKQAARNYRRANPTWPKSLEDIKSAPELKPYEGMLKDVKFDLTKVDNDDAYYKAVLLGRESTVKLGSHNQKQTTPQMAGAGSAG